MVSAEGSICADYRNSGPFVAVQEDDAPASIYDPLDRAMDEIEQMMLHRHEKYGPGNIAKHGPVGILVRMDDKFARLESGSENFDDETVENTLDDIIGYALIWKLWIRKQWPGSE